MSTPRTMSDPEAIKRFLFAGNATITLKSLATEQHYTFRARKAKRGEVWFVSVLANPDQYVYVGILGGSSNKPVFLLTKKSRYSDDAGLVKAFRFFYNHLMAGKIPEKLEVRHEGNCGRCNRQLTVPLSIDRGIGPECWGLMGGQ
jgi:hypothetical protein